MIPLLSIIAFGLAVAGIWQCIQGQWLLGLFLIVLACVVGPGGFSIFNDASRR